MKRRAIYRLYWEDNEYYYYGQTSNLNQRFSVHKRDLIKGKHHSKYLQNVFNKYGLPSLEVILEGENLDLDKEEGILLAKHVGDYHCCNSCTIPNSRLGTKLSSESIARVKEYQYLVGKNKPVYMFSRDHMHLLGKFRSISEAEKAINCYPKDIQKSCKFNGKYNVKGYKFMYAAPIDNFLNHLKDIVKL
jgi:hypothetical protein